MGIGNQVVLLILFLAVCFSFASFFLLLLTFLLAHALNPSGPAKGNIAPAQLERFPMFREEKGM